MQYIILHEMGKVKRNAPKQAIAIFQEKLLAWYHVNGRHHLPWRKPSLSPFEITIAEVLLQRTKAETVEKFYEKFLATFPGWDVIANADLEAIEEFLRPVGLYRQRAKRLKDLAVEMSRAKGEFPGLRAELEAIPLLGQYIANAIELQVFGRRKPLLDVNMARVLERYFWERQMADIRYDPYLQKLATSVVDHPCSKEINWAILDFAAAVCQAKVPKCEICSFSNSCKFYNELLN